MPKALSQMSLEELWELFPIILEDHNLAYQEWYLLEKARLYNCLGEAKIKRINHIGSTAVKGLLAKPTVDILVEVDKTTDAELLKSKLQNDGWLLMSAVTEPELKMAFNKGYTLEGFAEKVYHLHLRYLGDWDELYFRDYLGVHDEVAAEYGKLKLGLLEKYEHNRDGYTEAKTDFIIKHTELARKEFGDRYVPEL